MHLDPQFAVWFNRLGIVLNFLAGFMLAPELIGVERLNRMQERFAAYVVRLGPFSDFVAEQLHAQTALRDEALQRLHPPDISEIRRWRFMLLRHYWTLMSLHVIAYYYRARMVLFGVYTTVVVLIQGNIRIAIHTLRIRGGVRTLLVIGGIAFFIFGNLIQLVATFT